MFGLQEISNLLNISGIEVEIHGRILSTTNIDI